jgi:presenilin-like A22 family membrane protease
VKDKLSISFPELGILAATRGMIGAGIGLLLANRMSREKRRAVGLPLFIVGALSTIPIAMHLFSKEKPTLEA